MKSKEEISNQVDRWIAEEQLPVRATLKPIKGFDPYDGWSEDEVVAYSDFMQWWLSQDHLLILSLPIAEDDDWLPPMELDQDGNNISAFNTHDFDRRYKPNTEHWLIRQLFDELRNIAIDHSCISDEAGKAELKAKYDRLVDRKIVRQRNWLLWRYENIGCQHEDSGKIRAKIATLNSRIHKAQQLWKEVAYWD